MPIIDLHKDHDGVYRENVSLDTQIKQDAIQRSTNWSKHNHTSKLKDMRLSREEWDNISIGDSMSICDT